MSEDFYKALPALTQFSAALQGANYQAVPLDWFVVITDVVSSTQAIEGGKYKQVNTVGTLCAAAIANVEGDLEFPFVFGGDGMTFLISPARLQVVLAVLLDTQALSRELFGLELRVGAVPVADLAAKGHKLEIAKYQVSAHYRQVIITGSGIEEAEHWIKDRNPHNPYLVRETQQPQKADFTGYTCRWKDIPSSKGEILSLIIKPRDEGGTSLLPRVLEEIRQQCGEEQEYHPLTLNNLQLANSPDHFENEAKTFSRQAQGWKKGVWWLQLFLENLFAQLVLLLHISYAYRHKQLQDAAQDNIINSDFKKFDGALKMVLACSLESRLKLVGFLEQLYQERQLYYGVHVADRALMTCFIQYDAQSEVHFIDGADGGYALAAKQLKGQLAAAKTV